MNNNNSQDEEYVVEYAIPGNKRGGGRLFVYGDRRASRILLFLPGFPDDARVFEALARQLAATTNCLCGITCLTGYDLNDSFQYKKNGYTFEECVTSARSYPNVAESISKRLQSRSHWSLS